jgi:hypothetical protein
MSGISSPPVMAVAEATSKARLGQLSRHGSMAHGLDEPKFENGV